MSNASSIFNAARARVQSVLGSTYKEHRNILSFDDLSTKELENGYAVLLKDVKELKPQANDIFLERQLQIIVTHRTYASVDAGKVITTLATVLDKEALIIDQIRCWDDKTIGLIGVRPSTEAKMEPFEEGEDSFIVNILSFDILYQN